MHRLLWITAIPPCFDAGGGGEIRQAHLINGLAHRFDVHLLIAGRLADERLRSRVGGVTEVEAKPLADPTRSLRRRARDIRWQLLERQADEIARQKPVRQALGRALAGLPEADVVCVEYAGLAQLLPDRRRGLWVLTLHNLVSEMARHNAVIAPGARQRLMLGIERRNASRLEQWAVTHYDLVVTPSAEDATRLSPDVAVVPNGVDTVRFRCSPSPGGRRVVFTGALHTLPNRDGVTWFCDHIWPIVRSQAPDATLDIVGARPPEAVRALAARPGIELHADVPDVLPFLERADVAVVPLRIGTGSRLKALEAMACGRAVVGTSIGLGGLSFVPGSEALVGDEPPSFAAAIVRCLDDAGLRARLGRAARRLAEQRYGWAEIGAGYAELLERRLDDGIVGQS